MGASNSDKDLGKIFIATLGIVFGATKDANFLPQQMEKVQNVCQKFIFLKIGFSPSQKVIGVTRLL